MMHLTTAEAVPSFHFVQGRSLGAICSKIGRSDKKSLLKRSQYLCVSV